jgi:putative sigma-54 modulation protein
MNLEIRGIHYNVTDTTKEFFEKKLHRIEFAADNLVDLLIAVHKEPHQSYRIEAKVHFKWGVTKIVHADAYELY